MMTKHAGTEDQRMGTGTIRWLRGDESTKIYKSITLLWHVMRRARVGVGGGGEGGVGE